MKYLRMKTLLGGMGLLLMVAGLFDVSHAREMEMQELNPLQSCMVFYRSFLRSSEKLGWRDIGWHLPPGGQTS